MIKNKYIFNITCLLTFSLVLLIVIFCLTFSEKYSTLYQKKLFNNDKVNIIKIYLDNNFKNELLSPSDNNREYFDCDIYLNDELINNVGVRVKGGGSRKSIDALNGSSLKYSLKIKFDEYIKNQTYYGLDGIELNNQFFDKTFMRDYFAYDMMRFVGVAAPLVSFADVYVNDEYLGFYVCVENVKESFLKRNYGNNYGELYKPYGNAEYFYNNNEKYWFGNDLVYKGDDLKYYQSLVYSSKSKSTEQDIKRLIRSIKKLNSNNIKDAVDIDATIKYFAIHNFISSIDSYFFYNPHNYYLYEKDGLITMLPWDYDNAFCNVDFASYDFILHKAFAPIDDPLYSVEIKSTERPMWNFIISHDKYLNLYHQYLEEFIKGYFNSKYFEEEYDKIYSLIINHIYEDINKNKIIYKNLDIDSYFDTFKQYCLLRGEVVLKQLEGIYSTKINDSDKYGDINGDINKENNSVNLFNNIF